MGKTEFTKGLHALGKGTYAYLQPDGGWGLSNAGLIIDGDACLLIDTLFDETLTLEMLDSIKAATGIAPHDIRTLVNTHANGDHTFGNALINRAEILASEAGAEEMAAFPPQILANMMHNLPDQDETSAYYKQIFGKFDFSHCRGRLPTRTFSGSLSFKMKDKDVHLYEVGPAHTRGDVIVYIPQDRIVYSGDILFVGGTPIMWQGPVSNWLKACDLILDMDVDVIVPGHGPVTDKDGVRMVQDYLRHVEHEARRCFEAGLSVAAAVAEIDLAGYSFWTEAERIVVNVDTLYREYRNDQSPRNSFALFTMMAKIAKSRD